MIFLMLDLALIVCASRALGRLAERFGQPAVIGEISAGIILGPTVVGTAVSEAIFPHDVRSYLTVFANIGVSIFMFVAGLEMDFTALAGRRISIAAVAIAAYTTPFLLGGGVAFFALTRHSGGNRAVFVLFIACALAITAFPVLARILHDRDLLGSRLGQLAMAGAAIDDVLAWGVLAVVIGLARPETGHQWRLLLFFPFVALLWWVVRPALNRITRGRPGIGARGTDVPALAGALLMGAVTEWIGLHAIFGAFLFGVIFPRRLRGAAEAAARPLSSIFLPAFFIVSGLQVDLGSFDRTGLVELIAIMAAALIGKLGGTYVVARCTRLDRQESKALAVLMNTRGLTELVVVNIGLSVGLIDQRLYSLLVVMALVTTAMTVPLLRLCGVDRPSAIDAAEKPPAERDFGAASLVDAEARS